MWPVVHSLPIPDVYMTSQVAQYKEFACQAGDWVQSLSQEDPLEKEMKTHFSILPGKPHGQRRLMEYSPWGHKEHDTM